MKPRSAVGSSARYYKFTGVTKSNAGLFTVEVLALPEMKFLMTNRSKVSLPRTQAVDCEIRDQGRSFDQVWLLQ